jgi:hypothetical protein
MDQEWLAYIETHAHWQQCHARKAITDFRHMLRAPTYGTSRAWRCECTSELQKLWEKAESSLERQWWVACRVHVDKVWRELKGVQGW